MMGYFIFTPILFTSGHLVKDRKLGGTKINIFSPFKQSVSSSCVSFPYSALHSFAKEWQSPYVKENESRSVSPIIRIAFFINE